MHGSYALRLLRRLAIPLAIAAFMTAFFLSSQHLPFRAAGYPRFIMILLGATLLAVSVREILAARRERADQGEDDADTLPALSQLWPMTASTMLLVGFVIMIEILGIRVAVIIFTPLVLVVLGYFNIGWIIGITLGVLIMVDLVFIRLFHLPLPGVW